MDLNQTFILCTELLGRSYELFRQAQNDKDLGAARALYRNAVTGLQYIRSASEAITTMADEADRQTEATLVLSDAGTRRIHEITTILDSAQTLVEGLEIDYQHRASKSPAKDQSQNAESPLKTRDDDDAARRKLLAQQEERARADKNAQPQVFTDLGRERLKDGDPAAARRLFDDSLKRKPDNPEALSYRAQARLQEGDREGAKADARAALALDPNNQLAKLILGHSDSLDAAGRSIGRKGLDFQQRAAEDSLAAVGLTAGAGKRTAAPGGGAAVSGITPGSPLDRALALARLKDYSRALLEVTRALDRNKRDARAWALRSWILNRMGRHEAALKDAEQALALKPDDPAALREMAYALIQLGKPSDALPLLERAIVLEPGNALGYLYRAMAYETLGRKDRALADYETASRLDPGVAVLAEEAIARLKGSAARPASGGRVPLPRWAVRGGMITASLVLVLLGLSGAKAVSRRWSTPPVRVESAAQARRPGSTLAPGDVVGGNYRVARELGRGGMGVVLEAADMALQRRVAIKQLRREGRDSPAERELFLKEARVVARLKHPNLAEIHAVVNEGDLFLVFEYVEGESLDGRLRKLGRLEPGEARLLLSDVCAGLDYAHSHKIIHRDLKPSNIMVTPEGRAKIMDFGVAHQSAGLRGQTLTAAAGTPPYMAPEQALGSASPASDLYALGVTAYELVTGELPFTGADWLAAKQAKSFRPPSDRLPTLPRGLDAFFSRALEPDPAKRFGGAADFDRAFAAAVLGAPPNPGLPASHKA